jgi:hypothetical protein
MRLDGLWSRLRSVEPLVLWTVGAWSVVLVFVCVRAIVQPHMHSLYPTYDRAGAEWMAGERLYHSHWEPPYDQYRYSPLVAVLLVPFHLLPEKLGGVLWRLLNGGVFLAGFAWWQQRVLPATLTVRQRALLFLIAIPFALSSLNNGQPNTLVLGLLLAAVTGTVCQRWNLTAGCVALATALKIYPLSVGLLLLVLYPRSLAPRLVLGLLAAALAPFLFQHWDYVTEQYVQWFGRLGANDRMDWPLDVAYRDLWLLIRLVRLPMSPMVYQGLQLAAAAGCAGLCLAGQWRGWSAPQLAVTVLISGTLWMLLCGPATESCTYVLLAPAMTWGLVKARNGAWPRGIRYLPGLAFGLFLVSVLAGLSKVTGQIHGLGVQPLAALVLAVAYLVMALHGLAAAPAPDQEAVAARAA